MKMLIVEDDFTTRKILLKFLQPYGDCDVAVDGQEALVAYKEALACGDPYNLICLDIMMPELDGHGVLRSIREIESGTGIVPTQGVKIVMTTALGDSSNVLGAFKGGCEGYVVKPIDKQRLLAELRKLRLIPDED